MSSEFKPVVQLHALASKVLAVATTRQDGTWKAFVDAVPGKVHEQEYQAVLQRGTHLTKPVARVLFPQMTQFGEYSR